MEEKYIVFTSEYGSGARIIAQELAKKLGIKFYGEEDLLIRTAKESEFDEKVLREYDEKLANSKLEKTSKLIKESLKSVDDLEFKIYNAYSNTILKIVDEGSCILMERGADIVLKGKVKFLNIYAYSKDMEKKADRCERVLGIPRKDAPKLIEKQVMQRKIYYKIFSSIERGTMNEYDLCINTDTFTVDSLGMEKCAEIIKAAL